VKDESTVEERRAVDQARWNRNRVDDRPEGFTLTSSDRYGTIYYREGTKLLEISVELAGDPGLDIVVFPDGLSRWIEVESHLTQAVSRQDQERVEAKLRSWLANQNVRFSLGS
jgi:hypothetical protein